MSHHVHQPCGFVAHPGGPCFCSGDGAAWGERQLGTNSGESPVSPNGGLVSPQSPRGRQRNRAEVAAGAQHPPEAPHQHPEVSRAVPGVPERGDPWVQPALRSRGCRVKVGPCNAPSRGGLPGACRNGAPQFPRGDGRAQRDTHKAAQKQARGPPAAVLPPRNAGHQPKTRPPSEYNMDFLSVPDQGVAG